MPKHKVTVDFNNMRIQALHAYSRLVSKLNESIRQSAKEYGDNNVRVDPDDIQEEMDDLRNMLVTMAFLHEPGDNGFREVYYEAFGDGSLAAFNDMEENHEEAR